MEPSKCRATPLGSWLIRLAVYASLALTLRSTNHDVWAALPGDAPQAARNLNREPTLGQTVVDAPDSPGQTSDPVFVPGQVIITFASGVSDAEIAAFYRDHAGDIIREIEDLVRNPRHRGPAFRLVEVPADRTEDIAIALASDDRVRYAELNFVGEILDIPNDPDFLGGQLWGLHNTGQTVTTASGPATGTVDADIDAPEAWSITKGSAQNIAFVVDTGMDYIHPDLRDNLWVNPGEVPNNGIDDDGNGYVDDRHGINAITNSGDPMDDHGHGTHVAGTIGARGNNTLGVTGVNWLIRLAACKFLGSNGKGSTSNALKCALYINSLKHDQSQPVVVVNHSYGGGGYNQGLRDALAGVDQPGMPPILHATAAGNWKGNNDLNPVYPASYPLDNIVAVAATDFNDVYWWDTNNGTNYGATSVDIAAPGVAIWSTFPNNSYARSAGTSMAAPHVAGCAALILAQRPGLSALQVKSHLLAAGDPIGGIAGNQGKLTVSQRRLNCYQALVNEEACRPTQYRYSTEASFTQGLPATIGKPYHKSTVTEPSNTTTSTVMPSGQVKLAPPPLAPFPFVNVAKSGAGTVVRIDANAVPTLGNPVENLGEAVIGEYRTAPDKGGAGWKYPDPSRTTVDQHGSVWVSNREEQHDAPFYGSVTRIGVVIGGTRHHKTPGGAYVPDQAGQYIDLSTITYKTCQDRDNDGYIRTSSSLGDVLPWDNNAGVDDFGGVSTAEDECIINYVRLRSDGTRTVAVDIDNHLWVGGLDAPLLVNAVEKPLQFPLATAYLHEKIKADNLPSWQAGMGEVLSTLKSTCGGYGGLIGRDALGRLNLWSARGGRNILKIDTASLGPGLSNVKDLRCLKHAGREHNYGLGIDPNTGNVWHSSIPTTGPGLPAPYSAYEMHATTAAVVKKVTQAFTPLVGCATCGRGVAVDKNSQVWVAEYNAAGVGDEVLRINGPTGGVVGLVKDLSFVEPTGVAIDHNGKVWVTNRQKSQRSGSSFNHFTVSRINPSPAPGKVDLVVNVDHPNDAAPAAPYNYSDMTGFVAINHPPQGFWQATTNGGAPGRRWCAVCWNQEAKQAQDKVKVEVRAADSLGGLTTTAWQIVPACVPLHHLNLVGQYIEVRVTLLQTTNASPILTDLTLETCCGERDLGDAPDATNGVGKPMNTYFPPKLAQYPTVFGASAPHGPVHLAPRADAWLGPLVTLETKADEPAYDDDGTPNLHVAGDVADLDKGDDGVDLAAFGWSHCAATSLKYTVTIPPAATLGAGTRYVNAWIDFNRDGDWQDTLNCFTGEVSIPVREWVVRNHPISVAPDTSGTGAHLAYNLTSPAFPGVNPPSANSPAWIRVTLSGGEKAAVPEDGRGPAGGFPVGETEDYLFRGNQPLADLDLEKTHEGSTFPALGSGTFVLKVTNHGPGSATGFTITDPLPQNLSYSSASGAGWNCAANPAVPPQTVTCTYTGPPLASGASTTVKINVTSFSMLPKKHVKNCAKVKFANDINPENDQDCDEVDITVSPDIWTDLLISVTPEIGRSPEGQTTVRYRARITNAGPGTTFDRMALVQTTPPGSQLVRGAGSGSGSGGIDGQWECAQRLTDEVACSNPGALAAGRNTEVMLDYVLTEPQRDPIESRFEAWTPSDQNQSNNTAVDRLVVGGSPSPTHTPTPTATATRPPTPTPTSTPTPIPTPRWGTLGNISTRGWVGTGDSVLIGGFIISGGPAQVVIRAIGPDLTNHAVRGALTDPHLALHRGASPVPLSTNDDWQRDAPWINQLPAGLRPADQREAVIVATLDPGEYGAIVRGSGNATGVALVEVFHIGGAGILGNISTRGHVKTGDNIMIGGFINQSRATRVVIRAIGPSLSRHGVPGTLQDPVLVLFDGRTGARMTDDATWQTSPWAAALPTDLVPTDPREAVMALDLPPGEYGAHVAGQGGTTGIALVEVFRIER